MILQHIWSKKTMATFEVQNAQDISTEIVFLQPRVFEAQIWI